MDEFATEPQARGREIQRMKGWAKMRVREKKERKREKGRKKNYVTHPYQRFEPQFLVSFQLFHSIQPPRTAAGQGHARWPTLAATGQGSWCASKCFFLPESVVTTAAVHRPRTASFLPFLFPLATGSNENRKKNFFLPISLIKDSLSC